MRTELRAGATVGSYVLDAKLGSGSAATVWRARRAGAGSKARPVALKLFHQRGERVRAEAAMLGMFDHPHIVRLRDVLVTRSGPALVLDHADGGSLAQLLARRGHLSPGEVVAIGTGIGLALATAHARGVVHGDVHPGNVLLAADGRALLADFGLADAGLAGLGLAADAGGAAGYTAPEVERGARPSVRSDVWSLGAVCRAALGARGPTTLVVVLAVALAEDPADRFASADELVAALHDAVEPSQVLVAATEPSRAVHAEAPLLTRRFGPRPPAARRQAVARRRRRHPRE
ncbi:MAG: serine/threonine protein kinase, bacterial [Acidimicrobiaceae bacterium]